MKNKITYLVSLLLVCSLALLTNCGKDDDNNVGQMTDQQKATKTLTDGSPWQVTTVVTKPEGTTDDDAVKSLELSFESTGSELTITPGAFEATSSGDFFASEAEAAWSWEGTGTSEINLTGSNVTELKNIQFTPGIEDATSITVTFELTDASARVKGLGTYTVVLE